MTLGAVTGAAAVYHGCRDGSGWCLVLRRAHKKKKKGLPAFSLFRSSLLHVTFSEFSHRSSSAGARCAVVHEGQAETVSCSSVHCPGVRCGPCTAASWSCAGAEKQRGCTAGELPPASRLLKGAAVGNGSGHS